jgi:hypothetical protein
MRIEIVGRAAQNVTPADEAAHDQARLRRKKSADRKVDAFLDEIDHALAGRDIDPDIWIKRKELGHDGRDETRDVTVHVEAERAARRRLQGTGDAVGLVELGEYLRRPFEIDLADLGQADFARCPVEKTGA